MDLVVAGSIGLDDIETPVGKVKGVVGGSGIYASCGASYFSKPGLVAIMGNDFPKEYFSILSGVDLSGVEKKGKNFRWSGVYSYDMSVAKTLETHVNSSVDFNPILPKNYRLTKVLFLGNTDPEIQLKVINQVKPSTFIILDTMNYWIENKFDSLLEAIKKTDLLVVNDQEARQITHLINLISAGKALLNLGLKYVVIKKGEHGALLFSKKDIFQAPSYPIENLCDPTGAGDTFAGALSGYLSSTGKIDINKIKKAIVYGSVVASFCTERFSVGYKENVNIDDIEERYKILKRQRKF